jgi:hypothetical protein
VPAVELRPCKPGLGQGHNQKKDTHTLDFDVTLLNHLWVDTFSVYNYIRIVTQE